MVFSGSPRFARDVLEKLVEHCFKPELVITQPDRAKGRGRKFLANEVKSYSKECSIEIFQPDTLKSQTVEETLAEIAPDVLVVVAYGMIIPQKILAIPRFGGINVHASLLPRWRGAAPIERAIMAGDQSTGISIMQMDEGLDTGPIYSTASLDNINDQTVPEIEKALALLGSNKLIETLQEYELYHLDGKIKPKLNAQDNSLATYAHKITSKDRFADWKLSAISLALKTKALAYRLPLTLKSDDLLIQMMESQALPYTEQEGLPGIITKIDKKGIYVQCGHGTLQITRLKINRGQGKAMSVAEFLNGYENSLTVGQELNSGATH